MKYSLKMNNGINVPTATTKGALTQDVTFNKVNKNGKAYGVFSAKTAEGDNVTGIMYQSLGDKIGSSSGTSLTLDASIEDLKAGINNHWSPAFDVVSEVSQSVKDEAQAFLDSL